MTEADQLTNLELVMGALEQIGLVFSAAPSGGRMIDARTLLLFDRARSPWRCVARWLR